MLVVDKDSRPESSELCRELYEMQARCKGNQHYISQKTESDLVSRAQGRASSRITSPSAQDGVQGEGEHATTHDTGSSKSGPSTGACGKRKRTEADNDSSPVSKHTRKNK